MHSIVKTSLAAAAALSFAGATAMAAEAAGPEPYRAADPHYAEPMTQEPLIKKSTEHEEVNLGSADSVQGPDAGPEPYSAPTPQYKPMTSEPKLEKTKTPAPKL